jgi:hypothetical protein
VALVECLADSGSLVAEGMTTLTPDDITRIVEIAVRSAMAAQRPVGAGAGDAKGHLDERYFRRVEKFDGTSKTNWREFSFQFKVAVGMANPRARGFLEEIQKKGKDVNFVEIFNLEGDGDGIKEQVEKMGHELYAMLSALVSGEAMTVVRGVTTGDGWLAWSRLNIRFDPRTPAKALISMLAVMTPKKQKEIHLLAAAIEEWEMKVKSLGTDHDITIDDKIKQAVLTSMCPEEVQNLIFQWADSATQYEDIKDKVISLSQNRSAERKPKPMEIDWVRWEDWWYEDAAEQHENAEGDETEKGLEVDYVGESCRRCGGMGHYARECPTPKGKGKGGFDGKGYGGKGGYKGFGGKGGGKDGGYKGYYAKGGKDYGKGGKDFGKGGFKGACFKCGETGHRAMHCTKGGAGSGGGNNMDVSAVEESVVGGVWEIAAVEFEEWKEVKAGSKFKEGPPSAGSSPRVGRNGNMFSCLEVSETIYEGAPIEIVREEWPEAHEGLNIKKGGKVKKKHKVKGDEEDLEEMSCCAVACPPGLGKPWRRLGKMEITVDSAAEESVCPKEWCKEYGTKEPSKWLKFINASGGVMNHYGERAAKFKVEGQGNTESIMALTFQVSDVQKPLAAVRRIVERGNTVQFGPRDEDNFIMNGKSGAKIFMVRRGGSYVVPADMLIEEGFPRRA